MGIRFLTLSFAFFLLAIIALANTGHLGASLTWLHDVPAGDKVGHFLLMGTMSLLVNLCLSARRYRIAGVDFLLGSAIVASIVTLEELSQIMIATRSFSWLDLAADYLGIIMMGWAAAAAVGLRARLRVRPCA